MIFFKRFTCLSKLILLSLTINKSSPNRKKQNGLQTPAESPKKATVSELGGGGKVNDTATKGKLPEHEKAGAD